MKNRLPFFCLLILVLFLFNGFYYSVHGEELTAEEIIRNLQSTFAEVEDYTALIVIESHIKSVRIPRMELKVFVKQPDKIHLESKGFAMLPREGVFINPNRFNKEDFYMSILGKETLGDQDTFKLELVPRREGIRVRKLIIWVDPERWVIMKIDTVTWQGQSVEVYFQYKRFLDRYWLPVTAFATVDLTAFKGFSSFHERPDWEQGSNIEPEEKKGNITIHFYDYRINKGIPDSIFEKRAEKQFVDR